MGHTTNRRYPRVGKTTAANGLIKQEWRVISKLVNPNRLGRPSMTCFPSCLTCCNWSPGLLLALTSLTITTREKPWRVLSLSLEGHLDCPVCGIPLDPSPIVQPRYVFNSVA